MKGKPILPEELKIQILLRLSIKNLLRFKEVCKNWQSLIGSSTFITHYCSVSRAKNNGKLLWYRRDPIDKKDVISVIDCQITKKVVDLELPPLLNETVDNEEDSDKVISILGPVNGVYCMFNRLVDRWVGKLILWNPATGDCKHIIPSVAFPFSFEFLQGKWHDHWYYDSKAPVGMHIGFGFDDRKNDFKVLVLTHWEARYGYGDDSWHVRIYDLSNDSWRTIYYVKVGQASLFEGMYHLFNVSSYPDPVQCYLNGIFHWPTGPEDHILTFDATLECFQLIKGPPLPTFYHPCKGIYVLKGTLAMIVYTMEDNRYPNGANLWMMMQYGAADSWAMMYSFGPISGLTVIGIPNDDGIFFNDGSGQLMASNFDDPVLKGFGLYGWINPEFFMNSYGCQGVLKYEETFALLKSAQYEQHY